MAVCFLGYISRGEGFSQYLQTEFVLSKDCHPASPFLTGDQDCCYRKVEEPLQPFVICGEDGILKDIWSFICFYKYIDGLSSPLSAAI